MKNPSIGQENIALTLKNSEPLHKVRSEKKSSKKLFQLPSANSCVTSKRKLTEIIDTLCEASSEDSEVEEKRFYGYDKQSDYSKGPSGFQIPQTEDQKRYYKARFGG